MAANPNLSPRATELIRRALHCARSGDAVGTRAAAEAGLRGKEGLEVFRALLGGLDCQAGNHASGIAHFRAALAITPGDVAIRCNLIRALLDSGDAPGALQACTPSLAEADSSMRLLRLRAYLLQQSGSHGEAADIYRRLVAAVPNDYESWNNLGNTLTALGDGEAALVAIGKAVTLQPRSAPVRFNQAATLAQLGQYDAAETAFKACCKEFPADEKPRMELATLLRLQGRDAEALDWLEQAAKLSPTNADLQLTLGLQRQLALQMSGAEAALRRAIALQPTMDEGHILLTLHLEHMNAPEAMATAVHSAQQSGIRASAVHLLQAMLHRREKRFAEALAELDQIPADLEPIRAAQLRGECHERLGDAQQAWRWFSEMNRLQQGDSSEPMRRAQEYREALARDRALVTAEWYAGWRREPLPAGRTPVFLLGFPRSGTTLLDTMLMGHPRVQVLEERPTITRVEHELGNIGALSDLSAADIVRLREIYFGEARRWVDLREDSLLVDKFPLNLNKVPIIHRLFPEARFVLALRHPLDVLLSCYITNFRLNNAMVSFLDLGTAAWVYDQSFGFWEQSRQVFGTNCCSVSYERMVENTSAELRPLFDFLELEWVEDVLDHQRTASARGVITTASYSQVTEPIYKRAKGRWERYRPWLEPVLPMIQPWIERHGYQA